MRFFKHLLSHSAKHAQSGAGQKLFAPENLIGLARLTPEQALKHFHGSNRGLRDKEARRRIRQYGHNEIAKEKRIIWPIRLLKDFRDPLSLLLMALAIISFITRDVKATVIIAIMLLLSVFLRFFQETRANRAAQKLNSLVRTTVRVLRSGKQKNLGRKYLVPGDLIHLSAGDMVPADVRLLSSKDLFVNQATLTGEAIPVEKHADPEIATAENQLELTNICYLGTNVESGAATALVVASGRNTYLGQLAKDMSLAEAPTSFDIGIKKFTWLIMTFIFVMVPLVFILNGLSRGNWFEALLFSLAVAVGLAPEMLPMIVAVNLAKGAVDMSRKKVIVKHLDSTQNFGAMDILCTDKTGTITQGKVILEKYLNINGDEDKNVLNFAYLNSYFQTGLNNLMDAAVLNHKELRRELNIEKNYQKIDELPFDFTRRRMSVVIKNPSGEHELICKGAVEEILSLCPEAYLDGKIISLAKAHHEHKKTLEKNLNAEGFRVLAVAYKKVETKRRYNIADENNLVLLGFLAFLDPPKESAEKAIKEMEEYGVRVIILTGDNELVTRKICAEVGLPAETIVLGNDLEGLNIDEIAELAETTSVFAKLAPHHKEKIINALRQKKHTVGFLGDGINDSPALRAADIGISVDTAADIAKESSDIILLEKNLSVLQDGVVEGRKIFGNVTKYIQMAASSNFGNMFSVVGASIFLPFLPMLPIQVLVNNLFYDLSQSTIPTDQVDEEYLKKPRQWRVDQIRRFILFIGPISSIFDYAIYFIMLGVFNAWGNPALFHTGWFVESLISQTLIIYIIRTNKIPFIQSWPSWPLRLTTLAVVAAGVYLPFSFLAQYLGFVPLPPLYWALLSGLMVIYLSLTQLIKNWFNKKYKYD